MKKTELKQLIKEIIINEMPFGKQGYFPPMSADARPEAQSDLPDIYKGNTAIDIATKLKKIIDLANKELKQYNKMFAPFVNYYPSSKQGNLILGVALTKLPEWKFNRDDWKTTQPIEEKYYKKIEKILRNSNTAIYTDFHNGISGKYNGANWQSGIVYSIVTPERLFNNEIASKLYHILN